MHLDDVKKVHFIGIGGYGMSALAQILLDMGLEVCGSDLRPSKLTRRLAGSGAVIHYNHDRRHIRGADLVVYSTAIPDSNPELAAARRQGVPVWHRSELLAALLNSRRGIAVAGAHGKTTTSAMLSLILEQGGLDPTAALGGEVSFFNGNARLGKSDLFVAEACESDHSFLRYRPAAAIVTNIDADHLEHYGGDFAALLQGYRDFLANIRAGGFAVLCADDPYLPAIAASLACRTLLYGLQPGETDLLAAGLRFTGLGTHFNVYRKGRKLGAAELQVPGRHNVLNALGAISCALELGVPFDVCTRALAAFRGAGRRFEKIGDAGGVIVIDDYAHHPTEIRATLGAARQSGKRVICVFQPHRYTRTYYLMDDFAAAFSDADILILHAIYDAGEAPIPGITSAALAERIRGRANPRPRVYQLDDRREIVRLLKQLATRGDLVITMGAGDIWQVGRSFLDPGVDPGGRF